MSEIRVFDTSFDYKSDRRARTRLGSAGFAPDSPSGIPGLGDPDEYSPRLRADHQLLWTKKLSSGVLFAPTAPSVRRKGYLIFTDPSGATNRYGSDAITGSYTSWVLPKRPRSKTLVQAIAGLDENQKTRYLKPPYTIGSAMIWPVRTKDRPTMNTARGLRLKIADRMDLTLECIRRHYAGEPESPLADVIGAYQDFFALFGGFKEFVDFFHFQDLVAPDYDRIEFYLPFCNFERAGTPVTTEEYVEYRENTLEFIEKRRRRMAEWVSGNHPEIDVRH